MSLRWPVLYACSANFLAGCTAFVLRLHVHRLTLAGPDQRQQGHAAGSSRICSGSVLFAFLLPSGLGRALHSPEIERDRACFTGGGLQFFLIKAGCLKRAAAPLIIPVPSSCHLSAFLCRFQLLYTIHMISVQITNECLVIRIIDLFSRLLMITTGVHHQP